MTFPNWAPGALLAAFAVNLAASGDLSILALMFAVTFTAAFTLLGLTVVHVWSKGRRFRGAILAATYIALLFAWPALPVLIIGLAEHFFHLRARIAAKTTPAT